MFNILKSKAITPLFTLLILLVAPNIAKAEDVDTSSLPIQSVEEFNNYKQLENNKDYVMLYKDNDTVGIKYNLVNNKHFAISNSVVNQVFNIDSDYNATKEEIQEGLSFLNDYYNEAIDSRNKIDLAVYVTIVSFVVILLIFINNYLRKLDLTPIDYFMY